MGWFWSDNQSSVEPIAPHPIPGATALPPAGCPMHNASASSSIPPRSTSGETQSCPIETPSVRENTGSSSTFSKLNPLNYMPALSQNRAVNQTYTLPISREISSIPRGDVDANWEYPSPQQMYNAMLRKGWDGSDADAVESMVAVHNFLNEGAWNEIVSWERRFAGGLSKGWPACLKGEEQFAQEEKMRQRRRERGDDTPQPKLLRFMGRPKDMTPKARVLQFMGWAYPARFATEPPFDRHDWFVLRQAPEGRTREVRYVIDYYSGDPEPTGEPVFYLDVRPAIDGPTAAAERLMRWGGDVWHRASGAAARE